MAKVVSLPFVVPNFASLQTSGAAEFAMIGHPTAYNQTLNQATTIGCTTNFLRGFSSPQIYIPNVSIDKYKFIERYSVSFRYVYDFCLDIIKLMLEDGMYILYDNVDDFYLPGKSWYGTSHMHHTGIICGYDDNDSTLSIAAHDINWVFKLIQVPQKCFLQALKSSLDAERYGNMIAYKIKENTIVKIDETEMVKYLKEYMDSNFEKYPINRDGQIRGTVVHDYLAIYLDKLADGSVLFDKMDWRALRPIWEHKKCMLDRIKAVESKNNWSNELSKYYEPVVEKANLIRMMYAMYHKNHNDKLIEKIHDGLMDVAKSDRIIVAEFIKALEKQTL